MAPEIRASILGNCARFCCFATSRHDANLLGTEFGEPEGKLIARMLPDLPTGSAVMKTRGESPVILRVEPPTIRPTKELIEAGRSRCLSRGQSRQEIEADARKRVGVARPVAVPVRMTAKRSHTAVVEDSLPEGYDDAS
jgi:hypothetical protein